MSKLHTTSSTMSTGINGSETPSIRLYDLRVNSGAHILCFAVAFALGCARAATPAVTAVQSNRNSSLTQSDVTDIHQRAEISILPLHNGVNQIDLLGNGLLGEVVVSRRDNGNAHGFSIVLFQVLAPTRYDTSASERVWQVIPFFGGPHDSEAGEELFQTAEGADCTLGDLRVIRRGKEQPVEVVIGSREFGASFADTAAVRFDFYELRDARDDGIGPTYLFRHVRTVHAEQRYCDVDDAFAKELSLGPAGILRWDGPR